MNLYTRIGLFEINDVLPFVISEEQENHLTKELKLARASIEYKKIVEKMYSGQPVKMTSHRYRTFKKSGIACVKCGIRGQFFALERIDNQSNNNGRFHLNLYAINESGEEVLLTKDHIVPKKNGGKNTLENYQTMCYVCNHEKADKPNEQAEENQS